MKYPVIAFLDGDKNVYSFEKKDAEICLIDLIRIFDKAIFFDSDLKKHFVENAVKVSWAYIFGYHPLLKGRSAKIKFRINQSEKVSVSDVKNELISKLDNGVEKGFWYSKKDIPGLKEKVNEATDFNSLARLFSEDI